MSVENTREKGWRRSLILGGALLLLQSVAGQTQLFQEDFNDGTLIISEPGEYVLAEDIVFAPNVPNGRLDEVDAESLEEPEKFMFPTDAQRRGKYSNRAYNLGFFAAIAIDARNVVLDLNGHSISQSEPHVAMQRFFAVIELTNTPFMPNAGPADFSTPEEFLTGVNVTVKDGVIGNSAHHGVHCNGCTDILLENLVIEEFEVAGILLNNAKRVKIINVDVRNSRRTVRWSGRLSNAIFSLQALSVHIAPFLDFDQLSDFDSHLINLLRTSQENLRNELRKLLAFEVDFATRKSFTNEDVSNELKKLHPIFPTVTNGLPDGSLVAGIMIHPRTNTGEPSRANPSSFQELPSEEFYFENVSIKNLAGRATELTVLKNEVSGTFVKDMIGAVLDIDASRNMDSGTFTYTPNPLAEMQLCISRLRLLVEDTITLAALPVGVQNLFARDGITPDVIDWCNGDKTWFDLVVEGDYSVQPNHDTMVHFIKGVIGLKIEETATVELNGVSVSNLENHATAKDRSFFFKNIQVANTRNHENSEHFVEFDISKVNFNKRSYHGHTVRGVSFAADSNVIGEVTVADLFSFFEDQTPTIDYLNFNEGINVGLAQSELTTDADCSCEADLNGLLNPMETVIPFILRDEFRTLVEDTLVGNTSDNDDTSSDQTVLVLGAVVAIAFSVIVVLLLSLYTKDKPRTDALPSVLASKTPEAENSYLFKGTFISKLRAAIPLKATKPEKLDTLSGTLNPMADE